MFDAIRTIASTLCLMQFELLHQHEVGCNTNYYIDMRLDARGSIASPFWFDAIRTIASMLCSMQFEVLHRHEVGCNTNYHIDMSFDAIQTIAST